MPSFLPSCVAYVYFDADLLLHGEDSRLGKRATRVKKRKDKAASRARKKYGGIDQKQDEGEQDGEVKDEKGT